MFGWTSRTRLDGFSSFFRRSACFGMKMDETNKSVGAIDEKAGRRPDTRGKSRKRMVSMRVEEGVIEKMKARASHVGIPYQTLAASVLKRFVEGKLDIELT